MFSTRTPGDLTPNPFAAALARVRARGGTLIDLTDANPTSAGFDYPERTFTHLDLPSWALTPAAGYTAVDALLAGAGELALRGNALFERSFRVAPAAAQWPLDSGVLDDVVITGGAGAIGLHYARYLAERVPLAVVTMGALAILHFLGVRAARHWPLVFLGLATFLFIRNDPRAWPLGPAGFWESLTLPDVLQHRTFVFIVVAFGLFEWMVRTGRLAERPWGYVFPLLCAAGGGLLLTHSHAMFNLKDEFLSEVTHAPLGILGAFAGWGRWLELRLPAAGRAPGWTWRGCFTAVGLILLFYREG